jgi:hypothetical protein
MKLLSIYDTAMRPGHYRYHNRKSDAHQLQQASNSMRSSKKYFLSRQGVRAAEKINSPSIASLGSQPVFSQLKKGGPFKTSEYTSCQTAVYLESHWKKSSVPRKPR